MPTIFEQRVPWYAAKLMPDFGMTVEDAAAVMGNAGHESGGFKFMQELRPVVPGSRGGFGIFQWTGPRRRAFESYCSRNNLDPNSDKAQYGFLFLELKTSESPAVPAVKNAVGLRAKVVAFEAKFERAGVKHYASREKYARIALGAISAASGKSSKEAGNKAATSAGGGVTSGAAAGAAAVGGWSTGAIVAACGLGFILLAAAGIFGYRWYSQRQKAREADEALANAIAVNPILDEPLNTEPVQKDVGT